jgi:hypothetical protein
MSAVLFGSDGAKDQGLNSCCWSGSWQNDVSSAVELEAIS